MIDGTGLLAMPGFINGHAHAAMTMLRGAVEDVPIEAWFNDHVWPIFDSDVLTAQQRHHQRDSRQRFNETVGHLSRG